MRAKHKSGFVWTERGPDPDYEAVRAAPALVVDSSPQPASPLAGRKVCPHDGDYVDGYPRCGFCLGAPGSATTAEESFAAFLLSLQAVAKKVAESAWRASTMCYDDRASECFMLLLNPKHLEKIATADSPMAMAYTIAKSRLNNVYRDPFYKQTTLVSQTRVRNPEGKLLSSTGKMDSFTHRARQASGDYNFRPDNIRLFPGFALLWTTENIRRLVNLMKEALDKLLRKPFSHALMIKLRHGALGDEAYTWSELAKSATDSSGKNVTTDQVRYAVAVGEAAIRAHILKSLVPTKVGPGLSK
jgi:hypothetical protein